MRRAGSSQEYQKWVVEEAPRWRDVWDICPPLAGSLPIDRLFELCPPTAPRFYSISSSLLATPSEVAVTVGQLAYQLPSGEKRKARCTSSCDADARSSSRATAHFAELLAAFAFAHACMLHK